MAAPGQSNLHSLYAGQREHEAAGLLCARLCHLVVPPQQRCCQPLAGGQAPHASPQGLESPLLLSSLHCHEGDTIWQRLDLNPWTTQPPKPPHCDEGVGRLWGFFCPGSATLCSLSISAAPVLPEPGVLTEHAWSLPNMHTFAGWPARLACLNPEPQKSPFEPCTRPSG